MFANSAHPKTIARILALACCSLAPCAHAAAFLCNVNGVAAVPQRIHIRCSNPQSGIQFFALGIADQNNTARVLALGSAALVAGRQIYIDYDPGDLSGVTIGCGNADCRLIGFVELK